MLEDATTPIHADGELNAATLVLEEDCGPDQARVTNPAILDALLGALAVDHELGVRRDLDVLGNAPDVHANHLSLLQKRQVAVVRLRMRRLRHAGSWTNLSVPGHVAEPLLDVHAPDRPHNGLWGFGRAGDRRVCYPHGDAFLLDCAGTYASSIALNREPGYYTIKVDKTVVIY